MMTLVRSTNWLGDAVLNVPAIAALKGMDPLGHLAVLAIIHPWMKSSFMTVTGKMRGFSGRGARQNEFAPRALSGLMFFRTLFGRPSCHISREFRKGWGIG